MKGQVFTIAKLHYINGVVYQTAQEGSVNLSSVAKNFSNTTKSGKAKHPLVRVRTLARFAEGLGLIRIINKKRLQITELGRNYHRLRSKNKWSLTEEQRKILREHLISNPSISPTIYSIMSLLDLVKKGFSGTTLTNKYAYSIEKEDAWKSKFTYEGFTKFGLNYIEELGFFKDNKHITGLINNPKEKKAESKTKKTFLFTWNPNKWEWTDLPQAIYEANVEGRYLNKWSCGVTKNISIGDRAFLMRLSVPPKGIMGSGVVVSKPFETPHWDPKKAAKGKKTLRVEILFDILSESPILTEKYLSLGELGKHNWFPMASATHIPKDIAKELESIWLKATNTVSADEETYQNDNIHIEGTKRTRLITTYERSTKAREECIAHHGTRCKICGLSFEERYGHIGKGFMHVHHVVPVSQIGKDYRIDPTTDLCPVCPNCHAMIHKKTPPYTISELKSIIQ